MKIILKMNNNLTSGKVINVGNQHCLNNQPAAASHQTNGQIYNRAINYQIVNNQIVTNNTTANNPNNKPVIERGASWSFNETRALLSLWGQDMVQRQLTNSKRTRHVWEKIAEKLNEIGYHRSPDQVRYVK